MSVSVIGGRTFKPAQPARPSKRRSGSSAAGSSADFDRAAAEVKSLFHLPQGGKQTVALPRASRLLTWILCIRGVIGPVALVLGLFASLAAAALATVVAFDWLAGYSPVMATVLLAPPALALAVALILLILPLRPGADHYAEALPLRAADNPRLFMLIAGVCKIIKAPVPGAVYLTARPRLRASLTETSPWTKTIDGGSTLILGTPMLGCLTVRELSGLLSRECGRLREPELRRPYLILLKTLSWLEACQRREPTKTRMIRAVSQLRSEYWRVRLCRLAESAHRLQWVSITLMERSASEIERLLQRCDPVARRFELAISGNLEYRLQQKLDDVQIAYGRAIETVFDEQSDYQLVDRLALLTKSFLPGSNGEQNTDGGPAIVRSDKCADTLLDTFAALDVATTRRCYHQVNPDLDTTQLVSLSDLQRRQATRHKLEAIARDYYGSWFHHQQFWRLPADFVGDGADRGIIVHRLNECIRQVRYMTPDRARLLNDYQRTLQRLAELNAARKMLAGGEGANARRHQSVSHLDRQTAAAKTKLKEYGDELIQQNAIMGQRISLGLALATQYRSTTEQIHRALGCLGKLTPKLRQLQLDLEELAELQQHKPEKITQQYQLYVRELEERIEIAGKLILRKTQHCPYGFYDRRYPSLSAMIRQRLERAESSQPLLNSATRARMILEMVSKGYTTISQIAAGYAARTEKALGVETVKQISGAS